MFDYKRKDSESRQEHDFYATDSRAIPPLLNALGWQSGGKVIWENSCGAGHLSRPMEAAGHTVISTDLIDRGFGIGGIDFLQPSFFDTLRYDAIIMNPPYKHALKFIKKSLNHAPIVCAFLRLAFLESDERYDFFMKSPVSKVLVFSNRIKCAKDARFDEIKSGATANAWFVWIQGYEGKPTIEWIKR